MKTFYFAGSAEDTGESQKRHLNLHDSSLNVNYKKNTYKDVFHCSHLMFVAVSFHHKTVSRKTYFWFSPTLYFIKDQKYAIIFYYGMLFKCVDTMYSYCRCGWAHALMPHLSVPVRHQTGALATDRTTQGSLETTWLKPGNRTKQLLQTKDICIFQICFS